MLNLFRSVLVSVGVFLALASSYVSAQEVVNVYSARHYDTDLALYKTFEKQTGIRVNLIEAASDALIERIVNEGKYSPADLLITVDAGRLYRAEQKEIFSSVNSSILEKRIPDYLRHPEGLWFGLSKRARVIIYNKKQGLPENLTTYADLASSDFKGSVCMRSSNNIYNISLLAAMLSHEGEKKSEDWAKGVVKNLYKAPGGNDTANINAVASGECRVSLVNSYYLARLSSNNKNLMNQVGVIFPNQADRGTHVNISGAGVLKYAPNRKNAIRFLEFLTESEAQSIFVAGNNEYPVVEGAEVTEALKAMGSFKEDTINANELGVNQAAAVRVFDRAGWH